MTELNKKYLDQSGVQEIVKKLAVVSANLSATDANLQAFIENITALFYGDADKGEFPSESAPDSKANPVIPAIEGLIKLVGEWTENEQYLPDDDMNNTVIDVLKRVRDLVGKFADEQNEEGKTVIEYFQDAIDAEVERATKAEAGLQEQLGKGFDKDNTVADAIDAVKDGFNDLLYNEEAEEKPFEAEAGKTVRGEIVKTRDYIRDNVFVSAEGLYADGWMDIAFKNAKGEVIGANQLTPGKVLEGDVTMQFDFTRLTRDAFLKEAKQVKVITVEQYITLANETPDTAGVVYTNLQAGKAIVSTAPSTAKVAYDVNTCALFGVETQSVAEENGLEYKKLNDCKLDHLYIVFVFELKSDDVEEQMGAKDTIWIDVANLIKSYAFYANSDQTFEDNWDNDKFGNYLVENWFEFSVFEADRVDDAQKKDVTYTLKITEKFAEYMMQVDTNKEDIQKLKDFVGYSEDAPTDGPTLQEQIDAEVERAEAAEQEINDKLGNHGKDAEGNTLYDDFNEDLEAETVIGAVNEVDDKVNTLDEKVGNLEDLNEDLNGAESVVDAVNKLDEKLDNAIGDLSNWEDHEGNKHETVLDAVKALDDCVDNLEDWVLENTIELGAEDDTETNGTINGYFNSAFGALGIEDLLKSPQG